MSYLVFFFCQLVLVTKISP